MSNSEKISFFNVKKIIGFNLLVLNIIIYLIVLISYLVIEKQYNLLFSMLFFLIIVYCFLYKNLKKK